MMGFLAAPTGFGALIRYLEQGLEEVEGWFAPTSASIVAYLGLAQSRALLSGDVCEIGIHHGRLFLVLANLTAPGETAVAVDVFSDQHKNVDRSGEGNREIFERHLRQYAPQANVKIIQESSLDLSKAGFTANRFRIFSIDGGHSAEATENDLRLAEACSIPGTIVLLDDVLSSHWLGVMSGMVNFFKKEGRLVPFAMSTNKLYLTTDAVWADRYRKELRINFPLAHEKADVEFFDWKLDCYGEHPTYDHRRAEPLEASAGSVRRYDGLLPTEMRRLKQLEDENAKLRKVVADLGLDKERLQDALRRVGEVQSKLEDEVGQLRSEVSRLQEELNAIRSSTSWRLTGPARAAVAVLRQVRRS